MRVDLPIIGGAYEHRDLPISAQTLKNWYVEVNPTKDQLSLQTTPGAKPWSVGDGSPYVPPPPADSYGAYIMSLPVGEQPELWIRGYKGIVNDGQAGGLTVTTRAAGYAVENLEEYFDPAADPSNGAIDPSGGGVSFLTSDDSLWTPLDTSDIASLSFAEIGNDLEITVTGLETITANFQLSFGVIPAWEFNWVMEGVSGTFMPAPNNPVRTSSGSLGLNELMTTGAGKVFGSIASPGDQVFVGPETIGQNGNWREWGYSQAGVQLQPSTDGTGPTGTYQLRAYNSEPWDTFGTGTATTAVFKSTVYGHAGFNWYWPEITFPVDSDYTFTFFHTWSGTFQGLTAGPTQLMFVTDSISIGYESGALTVVHQGTGVDFGTNIAGSIAITFSKNVPDDGFGDLTLYENGGLVQTVSGVPTPATPSTFEAIGNNTGGNSVFNYFPMNNSFSEEMCFDYAMTAQQVADLNNAE